MEKSFRAFKNASGVTYIFYALIFLTHKSMLYVIPEKFSYIIQNCRHIRYMIFVYIWDIFTFHEIDNMLNVEHMAV